MANAMDRAFNNAPSSQPAPSFETLIQQAKQNPAIAEDYLKKNNPQAYQVMLQLRNSPNPRAAVMQMVQQGVIKPNILNMLGIR